MLLWRETQQLQMLWEDSNPKTGVIPVIPPNPPVPIISAFLATFINHQQEMSLAKNMLGTQVINKRALQSGTPIVYYDLSILRVWGLLS